MTPHSEWIFILIAFAAEGLKFDQAKTYPIVACSLKIQLNNNVKIIKIQIKLMLQIICAKVLRFGAISATRVN